MSKKRRKNRPATSSVASAAARDRATSRRVLAGILALVMLLSILAVTAQAIAGNPDRDPADTEIPSGSGGGFGG